MLNTSNKNRIYKEKETSTFRQLVDIATNDFNSSTAFTIKDSKNSLRNVSFLEFRDNIKQLGTGLINLNLQRAKIGLLGPDRYEWCCSYLAIATSNNIIVPLDYLLPHTELQELIIRSGIETIIFDTRFSELIKSIKSIVPQLKNCICMDLDKSNDDFISYQEILSSAQDSIASGNLKYDNVEIDKDALSVLIYTSGTTSAPKAVMLSQYNICSNVTAMTTLIRHYPNDSILLFLPLHHTLACMASFLFCYYIGFRLCFADSLKDIGKNMNEYGISGLVCVPAVLDIMYKQVIKKVKKSNKYIAFKVLCCISNFLKFFNIDLRRKFFKEILDGFGGNLRTIIYGSASSGGKVIKFFNTIGVDMIQGYGLTETSPVIACQSDKYHSKIGSTGYPLYNEQVKIDNPDKYGMGEILVKGPNIMLGYFDNPELTNLSFKDGWFCTGDLGKLDRDGSLWITGRKKDVIVLHNGKNVFPEELESLLNKIDLISESMIYEGTDANGNQRICAKIVYSKDNPSLANLSDDDIYNAISIEIKKLNKNLPVYSYVRYFFLTQEPLIKTTSQKIKRNEEIKKITN